MVASRQHRLDDVIRYQTPARFVPILTFEETVGLGGMLVQPHWVLYLLHLGQVCVEILVSCKEVDQIDIHSAIMDISSRRLLAVSPHSLAINPLRCIVTFATLPNAVLICFPKAQITVKA